MATTHDISRFRPRPGTPAYEKQEEARAVDETCRRHAERKAHRRAAWGMNPASAWAVLITMAVIYIAIGWIVNDIIESYDDPPIPTVRTEEPAPPTTTTGTLPPEAETL